MKDRAALGIITAAIDRGELGQGGLVVDGTAGNTGIGLTIVGNALGLKTVIVIPETQSQEKKDTLRSLGATLIEVPAVPYRNDNNYVKVAGRTAARLAREHPEGAIFANQFDNVDNRDIHVRTTGPEIWEQTGGKVDGFVSAIGTGGTWRASPWPCGSGIQRSRSPSQTCRCGHAQLLHDRGTEGRRQLDHRRHRQGRVTANLEEFRPDLSFFISDAEPGNHFRPAQGRRASARHVVGVNVAGAIQLARELGPGHTIVTMLCDPATRYQSRLFNPAFLRSRDSSRRGGSNGRADRPDFAPVPAGV